VHYYFPEGVPLMGSPFVVSCAWSGKKGFPGSACVRMNQKEKISRSRKNGSALLPSGPEYSGGFQNAECDFMDVEIGRTNLGFTDTDQLIERQTGMHIPQIFKIHGESHFRDLETGILQQLQTAAAQSRIISTGGGIIIRPEKPAATEKNWDFVVWLHTDVNILYQRISRCTNRPLLQQPNPKAVLEHLMN